MKYFVYIAFVGVSQALRFTNDWASDNEESF